MENKEQKLSTRELWGKLFKAPTVDGYSGQGNMHLRNSMVDKAYHLKNYSEQRIGGSYAGTTTRSYQWQNGKMVRVISRESGGEGT